MEKMTDPIKNHSGWIVAGWGWLVAHCPTASDLLVWVSLIVGVLQAGLLIRKYWRGDD